jgi:hypothetical protein
MNEQDKRVIYEWLYEDLRGPQRSSMSWRPIEYPTGMYAVFDLDGRRRPLPPLDMNTAFSECIPKLVREGVKVMYNNMGSGEWWLDPPRENEEDGVVGIFTSADFYVALLDYIKGVQK